MYAFFDLFRISYRGTFAAFMCAVLAVILLCYVIMHRKKGMKKLVVVLLPVFIVLCGLYSVYRFALHDIKLPDRITATALDPRQDVTGDKAEKLKELLGQMPYRRESPYDVPPLVGGTYIDIMVDDASTGSPCAWYTFFINEPEKSYVQIDKGKGSSSAPYYAVIGAGKILEELLELLDAAELYEIKIK